MKRVFIVLFLNLFISVAMADNPRLRGPSPPRSKRLIHTYSEHCCHNCRTRQNHIYYPPSQITVMVWIQYRQTSKSIRWTIPESWHKTIFIGHQSRQSVFPTKSRLQILQESKAKVRSKVYKTTGRKR